MTIEMITALKEVIKVTVEVPKYVSFRGNCLRYDEDNNYYYRDAGHWSLNWEISSEGILMGFHWDKDQPKFPLIGITKEEWERDNRGYF